jgi:sugar lactone lactonase YvrE
VFIQPLANAGFIFYFGDITYTLFAMKSSYRLFLTVIPIFSLALASCSKHAAAPTLNAEAMQPSNGPDSTQVTIGGTGFSATPADDLVSFNGKPAKVLSATTTALVVQTPTLAGTGEVTVTVAGKTVNAGIFAYDTSWRGTTITDTITSPEYVSMDGNGNLYVSSLLNSIVYKITPADSISPFASIPFPTGSTFDASGNLYVVSDGEYIVKVSPTGTVTPFATDNGYIVGIAMGSDGNLYVGNQNNNSVDMISPLGAVSVYDSTAFFCSGLAINNGNLYVVASDKPGVTGGGVGTILSMSAPEQAHTFSSGFDYDAEAQLTFDKNNTLYVTVFDQGNLQGQVFSILAGGISSTLLNMPDIPWIVGIVADPSGHLYVTSQQSSATNFTGSVTKLTMH